MPKRYDVIVIGSGGGTLIALGAAQRGLKTALIDHGPIGGTCLNRGCIPSKMLIYPAEVADTLRRAGELGIGVEGSIRADLATVIDRIEARVSAMSTALTQRLRETPGLDLYPETASFLESKTVQVGSTTLSADKIFIATGSTPAVPDLPGLAGTPYMTSTEALRNRRQPTTLLVIGAGYIATELGYAYRSYGARVHFLVRSRFLRGTDDDIVDEFERIFSRHHHCHKQHVPRRVVHDSSGFTVTCRRPDGSECEFRGDALLVATGVEPATPSLNLARAGIHTSGGGHIIVDDHLVSSVPGVYALGDVVGNYLFRHTVNYEARYLTRTALDGHTAAIDYGPVPYAVFTHPQMAGVGPTELDLEERGVDYIVGRAGCPESNTGEARVLDHGFTKVLVDRASRRILGAHAIGDEASNMIHIFSAFMQQRGTLDDMLEMIYIHPALPEIARDACRDAQAQLDTEN